MSFRDERGALRARVESLERELADARAEAERLREERDRALAGGAVDPAFAPGAQVYVEWRGSWWDAHVLAVRGPQSWRIRYDGWSSAWDEEVGPSRIASRARPPPGPYAGRHGWTRRARVAAAVLLVAAIAAAALLADREAAGPSGMPGEGALVRSSSELEPGQGVWIEWNGTWYGGSVVRAYDDGTVLVHYDGYADSYDERVTLGRLRVP